MPWALAKDEAKKDRLATVLYNLIESIAIGASLLEAVYAGNRREDPGAVKCKEAYAGSRWISSDFMSPAHKVTEKPEILFARLDLKEVLEYAEKFQAAQKAAAGEPAEEEKEEDAEPVIDIEPKEEITFDDFGKMQFQVGEIIACEAVKKSKKLLCSQVKIGSQVKQIVSGIKAHYSTGRDGRQEGDGTRKPETGEAGRRAFRGNAAVRRG